MYSYTNYGYLLHQVEGLFDVYKPFSAISGSVQEEGATSGVSPHDSSASIVPIGLEHCASGISIPEVSSANGQSPPPIIISRRNPLMNPGSILSWDNLKKWEMITREYLPYLQREYIIWGLFVITFILNIISANLQRFHPSILFNCLAMIIGVVSLSSRNKLYLSIVIVMIALSTVLAVIVFLHRKFDVVALITFFCDGALLYFLVQWLLHFRRLSQEDLMFFQAMTYSISRRVDDIVYFREHSDIELYNSV
ncbi:hypothetical protein AV274_5367 [Blastocystis sp. ATCC 50177/Nand II]|uniref:Uncharacterized protein n=1 Tax=Blastocystis sp. subtype 1 (strain ATCC 50177 / NandII) TaxID=478820 RepID=A0A196SA66_BLAHN|nr:hypothetical protein AV274_5367 [Blastocystis sp. ATCC 50177/Nand II]